MRRLLFTAVVVSLGGLVGSADVTPKAPYASDAPVPKPAIFAPGEISTGDYEAQIAFTADGATAWYLKCSADSNFWTIVSSRFENGHWTPAEVAPFSGHWSDADPFVSPDGSKITFVSKRPGGMSDGKTDLWSVERAGSGWGEPRPLGAPVNTAGREWYPTIASDGTLYFGSDRPGGKGKTDLWRARLVDGKYQEPENLGDAVNTGADEYEPFVAPDQSFLVFMASGRPDSVGGYDLYVSANRDGKWTPARHLPEPFNSSADELGPKVSPDGKYLFWTSARGFAATGLDRRLDTRQFLDTIRGPGNGLGDIYYVEVSALGI